MSACLFHIIDALADGGGVCLFARVYTCYVNAYVCVSIQLPQCTSVDMCACVHVFCMFVRPFSQ